MVLWKYSLLPCFEKQVYKSKHVYNKVYIKSKQLQHDDILTSVMSISSLSLTNGFAQAVAITP